MTGELVKPPHFGCRKSRAHNDPMLDVPSGDQDRTYFAAIFFHLPDLPDSMIASQTRVVS